MCGGGGGGGDSGTNWQDVKIQEDKDAKELRNWQQSQWDEQARQAKHTNEWNAGIASGEAGLRNTATAMMQRRGLNPDEYGGYVTDAIEGTKRGIGLEDTNPQQYFTDSVVENALGKAQDDRRSTYKNAVANRFSPGFEQNYFKSDADDPFINDFMNRQKQDALQYVKRAQDRGMLDNTGYGAAMQRIGEMESSGRATANKLGDAVLQGNRTRLTDIANEAKAGAGSYELGQSFDPNTFNTKFDETLGGLQGSLEGDVRGALDGQKFFDVGDIITRAGGAQGATNPKMESLDALAARDKVRNAPRGVAGGGTF